MDSYRFLPKWYDALTPDVPYLEFAEFYEKIFANYKSPIKIVLDIGCGTGTISFMMAKKGYEMISVDKSPEMLSVAMEKMSGLEKMPLLLCQDITSLDLYGTVDAAFGSLDVFNYINPKELGAALDRLKLFIRPGGLLVFDILKPDHIKSLDGEVFVHETEEVYCIWQAEFNAEEAVLYYDMDIFTKIGEMWDRSSEVHVEYAHNPDWLLQQLKNKGFADIKILPGPQTDCGRMHISAVREE